MKLEDNQNCSKFCMGKQCRIETLDTKANNFCYLLLYQTTYSTKVQRHSLIAFPIKSHAL